MSILAQNLKPAKDIYFIDRKKVITDLVVIGMREIYVHVYKIVNLLKNHMTIYMV